MKNNKGFAPIAIVLIIIAVLVVGGIVYYVGTKNNSIPQNTQENNYQPQTQNTIPNTNPSSANKTFSETEIIASLKTNWQSIQSLIPFRPGHPSTLAWLSPDSVQFVGKNNLFVRFEDGYNPGIAVLNFDGSKFKILETFKNQGDFTLSDWQNLVKKYGDSSYPVSTYTISLVRNKEIVSFQDLTKVPENVFLKNYYVVSQVENMVVKVYFRNNNDVEAAQNACGSLFALTRTVPKTEKIAVAAINELLKGPTSTEKAQGYTTDIPNEARLNSLAIVNGEARADFNSKTESGGSCNLTTEQIKKTLQQFSTVQSVRLSVDGNTQNIFQS